MNILLVAQLLKARNFQPLGLEYLAAYLKQAGHSVSLADASIPDDAERKVRENAPAIVGYYTSTGIHKDLIGLNRRLKRVGDFFSVFGGPHPSFFPEMINEPGVDAICIGEGEEAFVELAGKIEQSEDYLDTKNFHFKTDGGVVVNPLRPLVQDLDSLLYPDWSLSDSIKYCRDFPVKIFMASRGCPYSCTFCYNPTYRKLYEGQHIYRRRSASNFVDEIDKCKAERRFEFAYLFDDTFGLGKGWLEEFCALYKEKVGLPFYAHFRADVITVQGARLLADAGLSYAGIGLESGDESIRNSVLDKRVTDEQLIKAAAALLENKVTFATFNMLGIPDTALDDDINTLKFNWKLGTDFAEALMFIPYPRTVLGEKSKEGGLFDGSPDSIPDNFKRRGPLKISDPEKRTRLMYLFPILAKHKVSDALLNALLALPLGPVYRFASRLYEGAIKVLRIYRVSLRPSVLARMTWHYLRY